MRNLFCPIQRIAPPGRREYTLCPLAERFRRKREKRHMEYRSPLDDLIDNLSQNDPQAAAQDIYLTAADAPRPCTLIITDDKNEKPVYVAAEVQQLGNSEICFTAATDQARGRQITAQVHLFKSSRGETILDISAVTTKTRRVSENYEFFGRLRSLYRYFRPASQIFAQYAARRDPAGWNLWCASLERGVLLDDLNLRGADLTHFDLCCARFVHCDLSNCNLSGANLAGADLSGAKLDGVTVDDADFFGATLLRRYEYLPAASGLLERESVTLV